MTTHTNNYLYKGLGTLAQRLPRERHKEIVPLRSLLDAGVTVALATDNVPVSIARATRNALPTSRVQSEPDKP